MAGHPLHLVGPDEAAGNLLAAPPVDGVLPPAVPASRRIDLVAAGAVAAALRADPDPAVVFGQLARLCVPGVCDEVLAGVADPGHPDPVPVDPQPRGPVSGGYRSWWAEVDPAKFAVTVQIAGGPSLSGALSDGAAADGTFPGGAAAGGAAAEYVVSLTCSWWLHQPTADDVAVIEMLGRAAVVMVAHGRQAAVLAGERRRAANLGVALDSNRVIAAAVGILMARRHLTYEQAFTALRTASQLSNRKIAALADDILYTGDLPT